LKEEWKITVEIQRRLCKKGIRRPRSTETKRQNWKLAEKVGKARCFAAKKIPVQDFVNGTQRNVKMLLIMAGRKPEI